MKKHRQPECPYASCGTRIPQRFIRQNLSKTELTLFLNFQVSQCLRTRGFLHSMRECPAMECRETFKFDYPWPSKFRCYVKQTYFCTICFMREHPRDMECEDYKRTIGKAEEE